MKHLTLIFVMLLAVACGEVKQRVLEPEWVAKLDSLKKEINQNRIDVYLKYNQPFGRYEVTMLWQPFESKKCETGLVIVNFRDTTTNRNIQYVNTEKYNNYHTDQITFAEGFEGYKDGDIFYLDATVPSNNPYPESPLNYYQPFVFYDADFDGDEELLVSDWGLTQCGNCYTAYEITDKGLVEKIEAPLNHIDNMMTFDPSTNDIIARGHSGAWYSYELTYTKKNKTAVQKITIPNSFDKHLKDRLEEFASDIPTEFYITSAHIKLGDQHYDLIIKGNKWQINN